MRFLTIICIFLLGFSQPIKAQDFPLDVQLVLTPPFPTNLDAYIDYLTLEIVTVTNTTSNDVEAFFEASLEETSGRLSVRTKGAAGESFTVTPGVRVLMGDEIESIFRGLTESDIMTDGLSQEQRDALYLNRQLPEGSYRLCVKAVRQDGTPLSDEAMGGCIEFDILYPERPIIIAPFQDEVVDTNGFLIPLWDHVLNSADAMARTQYVLKIIDITEQSITNVQLAMLDPGVSPEYEEEVGNLNTVTLQDDIELPLLPGHQYAMRVTAFDPDDQIAYQFGGHSEIVTFYYGDRSDVSGELNVEAPVITRPAFDQTVDAAGGINFEWEQAFEFLDDAETAQFFSDQGYDFGNAQYEVRLIDVTGVNQNQIQRMLDNPATNFLVDQLVTGQKLYVPLSAQVPLEVGNRYAAEVEFLRPDVMPENYILDNEGRSELVTFIYGDEDKDFQPDLDSLLANHVQGQINWAFRTSEENKESGRDLIVSNASDFSAENIGYTDNNAPAGNTTYPLENATVVIYGAVNFFNPFIPYINYPLAIGQTGADGRFALPLNQAFLSMANSFTMAVNTPNGAFENIYESIQLTQTEFGYLMQPQTVPANSMRLDVQVLKEDYQPNSDQVSVQVLLQKDNFEAYPYLKQIAPGGGQIVSYNDDEYVVVQRITDGSLEKRLFQNHYYYENYVLQIVNEGRPSAFFPMENIYYEGNDQGKKVTPVVSKNLIYNVGTEVSGVVYYGDEPRRDVRVRAIIESEDVVGTFDSNINFERVTDEGGNYNFLDLPNLKDGAEIELEVIDYTIRYQAFEEKITFDGTTPITKDIYLKNDVFTGFGQLTDQYGLPVANALVQVDSNYTTRSTDDGFFMVKLHHPLPYYVSIVADGYEDTYLYPAWSSADQLIVKDIDAGLEGNAKAQRWKQDLEASSTVSTFMSAENINDVDAKFFGIGETDLITRYTSYIPTTENLIGTAEFKNTVLTSTQGVVYIEARYEGALVDADIAFEGDDDFEKEDVLTAGSPYIFSGPDGPIEFTITAQDGGPEFVQFFGELELSPNSEETVKINLRSGVKVSGVVKDKISGDGIAEASITIEGMDYNTESDQNGAYTLFVPDSEEFTFRAKASKYNRRDTMVLLAGNQTLDFLLDKRDENLPEFTKLAGYPIEIDLLEKVTDGFIISGELTLAKNELFAPESGGEILVFKDVIVDVDDEDEENAVPTINFAFETAEMDITAFDFAPVSVAGAPLIELRMLESDDDEVANKAYIGGTELSLQLESNPTFSAFPFDFPNATMKNADREDYLENQLSKLGFDISGDTQAEIDAKIEAASGPAAALFGELNFERLFLSPGSKSADLSEDAKYTLEYDESDFSGNTDLQGNAVQTDAKYDDYVVSKFALTKLLIHKDSSSLDKDGINMQGALEMPKFVGAKMKLKDNQIIIDKLSIGSDFTINELTFQVGREKPIKGAFATWEARLTSLSLYGLGTRNVGMGFGGDFRLKKDSNVQGTDSSHLVINSFNIINKEEVGLTVSADLSIKPRGIEVGNLKVSQKEGKSVAFSLSKEKWAFEIKAQNLTLDYLKSNAVTKKVFPVEILDFRMQSKDWSVFLAVKPNIQIKFGVMSVHLSKFLVNYGYDMGMDDMNEILKMDDDERAQFFGQANQNTANLNAADAKILRTRLDEMRAAGKPLPPAHVKALANYDSYVAELGSKFGSGQEATRQSDIDILKSEIERYKREGKPVPQFMTTTVAGWESRDDVTIDRMNELAGIGGDELLDEDDISWAIGISGGVQFPVKGMDTRIHASVLLARNGDDIDVRINEILLQLEQPAFKLFVSAELSVGGEKVGFAAQGEMETLKRKFAAGFKFFKYTNQPGVELGANLLVSTAIVTGPIMWTSIGGGFDFNTNKQTYKVWVTGSAGPAGAPKELSSLEDIYVSIFFDLEKCTYQPVVEGGANYVVKGTQYGWAKARLDFCKMSAYLDVASSVEFMAGIVTMRINGMVYVMKSGNSAQAFLGVHAKVSDITGIFVGNGIMVLGVEFTPDGNTPYAVKQAYDQLPTIAKPGRRFHGVTIKASMDVPEKKGDYGLTIGGFTAIGVNFAASASAYCYVFKSFDRTDFQVKGELKANASGELVILGKTFIGGSAAVMLGMEGGYVSQKWYFQASGYLNLEIYNDRNRSCGSVSMATVRVCAPSLPYPCGCSGTWPWEWSCNTCWTSGPCTNMPNLFALPRFKACTRLSFSAKFKQGQKTTISASKA